MVMMSAGLALALTAEDAKRTEREGCSFGGLEPAAACSWPREEVGEPWRSSVLSNLTPELEFPRFGGGDFDTVLRSTPPSDFADADAAGDAAPASSFFSSFFCFVVFFTGCSEEGSTTGDFSLLLLLRRPPSAMMVRHALQWPLLWCMLALRFDSATDEA